METNQNRTSFPNAIGWRDAVDDFLLHIRAMMLVLIGLLNALCTGEYVLVNLRLTRFQYDTPQSKMPGTVVTLSPTGEATRRRIIAAIS